MHPGRLLVLVLGVAIVVLGTLGIVGVWGAEPPPEPATGTPVAVPSPATGAGGYVPLGTGTITVTKVYEDGGSLAFALLALVGVAIVVFAWLGARPHPPTA